MLYSCLAVSYETAAVFYAASGCGLDKPCRRIQLEISPDAGEVYRHLTWSYLASLWGGPIDSEASRFKMHTLRVHFGGPVSKGLTSG